MNVVATMEQNEEKRKKNKMKGNPIKVNRIRCLKEPRVWNENRVLLHCHVYNTADSFPGAKYLLNFIRKCFSSAVYAYIINQIPNKILQ